MLRGKRRNFQSGQIKVTDAEVASLISTLATEPDFDPTRKSDIFEFLCLNHTFYEQPVLQYDNSAHDYDLHDIV
jgi:hypothetical protein